MQLFKAVLQLGNNYHIRHMHSETRTMHLNYFSMICMLYLYPVSIVCNGFRSIRLMVHKLMKFCFEKTGKFQKILACPPVLDSNIAALNQQFPLDKILMRLGWLELSGSHLNGTNVGCFL